MEITKTKNSLAQLTSLRIEFEHPIQNIAYHYVGIDPGNRNMGIAILDHPTKKHEVFEANLHQVLFAQRAVDVLGRIKAVGELLDCLCLPKGAKNVIIEGAAFGEPFRQVELEDVRAGVVVWFDKSKSVCQIVAPQTIRKNTFGNAKIKAHEYWRELEKFPDVAAALSCALSNVILM